MLSMLSLSISAIASQRAGRSPSPAAPLRGLAGPTALLVLSRGFGFVFFFSLFLLRAFPSLSVPPPPPERGASTEQNGGRRPLGGLAWRTDTAGATRPGGTPFIGRAGTAGAVMRLRFAGSFRSREEK